MGSAQSCLFVSVSAGSAYFLYVHVYRSHKLLQTSELDHNKLPSLAYLYLKYLSRAVARRSGRVCASNRCDVTYTMVNCRLDSHLLRRFCSVAGYGWDYPDSEFRDVPLCFPEFLCSRLLLAVLTDGRFRLSPAGLSPLRQTLRSLEPVDELKKGPFTLGAAVLAYRQTEAGVEADIRLSAASRTGSLVWESVLTLGSQGSSGDPPSTEKNQADPDDVKRVELRVPWTADLPGLWSLSRFSPWLLLLSLPARLLGLTSPTPWVLSVCLAEIEKLRGGPKPPAPPPDPAAQDSGSVPITVTLPRLPSPPPGVGVVTAPADVSVRFGPSPELPPRLSLHLWGSGDGVGFRLQGHGGTGPLLTGVVSRP